MINKKGKLVILVGIDGSGKSTLLSNLEGMGYCVSHWRKLKEFSLSLHLNFTNPAVEIQGLDGSTRLEFIFGYIKAEWQYLIEPALNKGKNVISDGFFIRFLAKEKIYQRLPIDEFQKKSLLSSEEFIIMIDTPAKIALERKGGGKVTPYECFRSSDDFVSFQEKQRQTLLEYIKDFPHAILDGTLSKEELVKQTFSLLSNRGIYPSVL